MSKSDILRGIITEKLSTAAREILAVVERTVADYEQEVSGFRREIDRQRRQLELLQPQVKLHRGDVEAAERHRLTGNHSDDDDDGDDDDGDDDDEEEDPVAISKLIQEDLKDPDYETPRSGFSRVQTARRRKRTRRTQISQNHLILRIWLLEDPETEVLSENVFQKSPVSILKCPRGLPAPAFLDRLRSIFPRLAAGEPFDVFTSDKSRKLQPLVARTAEEFSTARNATLYLRLKKTQVKMEVGEHLLAESASTDPVVLKSEETGFHTSFVGGVDGSISSTSQHQEQEAAQSNMVPMGTQVHWNETVKVKEEVKEEESSVAHLTLGPDPTEDDKSGLQISSVEGAPVPGGDTQAITSTSELDDLETDDDDSSDSSNSSSDTDQTSDEAVDHNQDVEPVTRRRTDKLTCRVCGTWYRQLGSLISHIWNHVNEPHGVCGVCGEKFESVETLKEHLPSHKKGYSCWICGKYLLSSVTLNRHIAKHVTEAPNNQAAECQIKCHVCSKTFSTMSALHGHSRVHLEKRPARCSLCPKWFTLKSDLIAHRNQHIREGQSHGGIYSKASAGCLGFSCKLCGKTFALEASLKTHEKTHAVRDCPFVCHICNKTFQTYQNLMNHTQTHGTDGSFVCNLCNMSFLSEETLNVHMIVHSETPYKCLECGRCFKRATYLVKHIKTHSVIPPCVCTICGHVSSGQEALEVHMRIHSGEIPVEQNLHLDPWYENMQEEPQGSSLLFGGQVS
ncbi:uncharacterized protein FYW61_019132 [Anableps anableps]